MSMYQEDHGKYQTTTVILVTLFQCEYYLHCFILVEKQLEFFLKGEKKPFCYLKEKILQY